MKSLFRISIAALCLFPALAGCHKAAAPIAAPVSALPAQPSKPAPAAPAAPLTAEQLAAAKPDESGVVPILEYHNIDLGKTTYSRSPEKFRADLQRLYDEGYRPVALHDYLDNRIDVPLGKTPVVLTFDDASRTQFRYLPDGQTDPDCALGILEAFHQSHPDFALKATFYVLPDSAFGQPAEAEKKMKELLAKGLEIGNHTVHHKALRKLSDTEVQQELAGGVSGIHTLAPEAKVDTLALPLGSAPKNRSLAVSGEYQGQKYGHRAVLLVGANPAPSPASAKFDPLRLPRIQACEGPFGITYWLDSLKAHPERRYVSDGDPMVVTVPKTQESKIDSAHLNGAQSRAY